MNHHLLPCLLGSQCLIRLRLAGGRHGHVVSPVVSDADRVALVEQHANGKILPRLAFVSGNLEQVHTGIGVVAMSAKDSPWRNWLAWTGTADQCWALQNRLGRADIPFSYWRADGRHAVVVVFDRPIPRLQALSIAAGAGLPVLDRLVLPPASWSDDDWLVVQVAELEERSQRTAS
jgi:hypothetical protein